MFYWIKKLLNGNKQYLPLKHSKNSSGRITFSEIDESLECRYCGSLLVERNGKYGKFLGCSRYPNCSYTKSWSAYIWEKAMADDKIIENYFGIISGQRKCYRCQNSTTVSGIALTVDNFKSRHYSEVCLIDSTEGDVYIVPWSDNFEQLPASLQLYILEHYPVKPVRGVYQNICEHCKAVQGDWYVYMGMEDSSSPFYYFSHRPLLLETIDLGKNLVVSIDVKSSFSSTHHYLERTTLKKSTL